jgi:hypothetical protein
MYLAVAALIVGQALLLGHAALLLYAAAVGAAFAAWSLGERSATGNWLGRAVARLVPS